MRRGSNQLLVTHHRAEAGCGQSHFRDCCARSWDVQQRRVVLVAGIVQFQLHSTAKRNPRLGRVFRQRLFQPGRHHPVDQSHSQGKQHAELSQAFLLTLASVAGGSRVDPAASQARIIIPANSDPNGVLQVAAPLITVHVEQLAAAIAVTRTAGAHGQIPGDGRQWSNILRSG